MKLALCHREWQEIKHIQVFSPVTGITIPSAEYTSMVITTERKEIGSSTLADDVASGLIYFLWDLRSLFCSWDYYPRFGAWNSKESQECGL